MPKPSISIAPLYSVAPLDRGIHIRHLDLLLIAYLASRGSATAYRQLKRLRPADKSDLWWLICQHPGVKADLEALSGK